MSEEAKLLAIAVVCATVLWATSMVTDAIEAKACNKPAITRDKTHTVLT